MNMLTNNSFCWHHEPCTLPRRVQLAANNFVFLNISETIWGLCFSLSWCLKLCLGTSWVCQGFCTFLQTSHSWGMFVLWLGKARCCLPVILTHLHACTVLQKFARARSHSIPSKTSRSPENWCALILPLQSFNFGQLSSSAFSPCLALFFFSCYASW